MLAVKHAGLYVASFGIHLYFVRVNGEFPFLGIGDIHNATLLTKQILERPEQLFYHQELIPPDPEAFTEIAREEQGLYWVTLREVSIILRRETNRFGIVRISGDSPFLTRSNILTMSGYKLDRSVERGYRLLYGPRVELPKL